MQAGPVETGAGIRFPARGDVAMADDGVRRDGGVGPHQAVHQAGQHLVLYRLERLFVAALQLDSNGEIVDPFCALEAGKARVPGAQIAKERGVRLTVPLDANHR